MATVMMIAVHIPFPKMLLSQRVDAITTVKKIMSPAMVKAQPVRKPCPETIVASRPVIGSTPNAIMISVNGRRLVPSLKTV